MVKQDDLSRLNPKVCEQKGEHEGSVVAETRNPHSITYY